MAYIVKYIKDFSDRELVKQSCDRELALGYKVMVFSHTANALFNGFGKTKATMVFSMVRLFGLRVPVLLFLMHVVKMDYSACGVAMFASNTIIGVIQLVASARYCMKLDKHHPELFERSMGEQ